MNALALPRLGLGCALLGRIDAVPDDAAAVATMVAAARAGVAYFDTAPLYGATLSERRLGAALRAMPSRPRVSTKVGYVVGGPPGRRIPEAERVRDYSAAFAERSIAASLDRLGLERIDIAFVHDPEGRVGEAAAGTVPALLRLREAGKIGAIGAGVNTPATAAALLAIAPLDAVLVAGRYTLLDHSAAPFFAECAARGVAVIAAGVFGSGILATGAERPGTYAYAQPTAAVIARVRAIEAVCRAHDVPLRAAALRFVAANPHVTCVLLGAGSQAELADSQAMLAHPIPARLWAALRSAGLLAPDLPTPDA